MTDEVKKKIVESYNKGEYSIQDLARIHNVEVEDVLIVTGNGDLTTVVSVGDMVDPSELIGTTATINPSTVHKAHYSKN
jgi:hypothetical protein